MFKVNATKYFTTLQILHSCFPIQLQLWDIFGVKKLAENSLEKSVSKQVSYLFLIS